MNSGHRTPRPLAATIVALAAFLVTGCAAPPEHAGPVDASETPIAAPDPAPVAGLIERYNDRIRLLDKSYGRGVVEFRWVDRDGDEHFEPQIDAKLWIDLPRHTALRGEKLGNIYIWLGSDADRYWMFDLVGDTTRLYVGRHDTFTARDAASVLVRPVTLLDLVGLTPLPAFDPANVAFDHEREVWTVTAEGSGGPMRVSLDPVSALPARIESLDETGAVVVFSDIGRFKPVRLSGMSVLALPRMPTLINIANPAGTLFVKLAFDEFTGETEPRVFDLEGLTRHLRPDRIEGPGAR